MKALGGLFIIGYIGGFIMVAIVVIAIVCVIL